MSSPAFPPDRKQTDAVPVADSSLSPNARLLVVRLSAMGDIIHAMPAITALRSARPDVQIGWLVEGRWATLLCAREDAYLAPRSTLKPLVDWVHVANFKSWRKSLLSRTTWREMSTARDDLRSRKYDVAARSSGCHSLGARCSELRRTHARRLLATARSSGHHVLYAAS